MSESLSFFSNGLLSPLMFMGDFFVVNNTFDCIYFDFDKSYDRESHIRLLTKLV